MLGQAETLPVLKTMQIYHPKFTLTIHAAARWILNYVEPYMQSVDCSFNTLHILIHH